jgi:hypothetical protein
MGVTQVYGIVDRKNMEKLWSEFRGTPMLGQTQIMILTGGLKAPANQSN